MNVTELSNVVNPQKASYAQPVFLGNIYTERPVKVIYPKEATAESPLTQL